MENKKTLVWLFIGIVVCVFLFALSRFTVRRGADISVSQRLACTDNLRQIDYGKEQWALDNHKPTNSIVSTNELAAWIKGGFPKCPLDGRYTLGRIGEPPTCTVPGHSLP